MKFILLIVLAVMSSTTSLLLAAIGGFSLECDPDKSLFYFYTMIALAFQIVFATICGTLGAR